MIIESHAHYDDKTFTPDRHELLSSLPENEIEAVINVGSDLRSLKETLALTEQYPFIYGALGIHPGETGTLNEENFHWLKEQCLAGHRRNRQGKIVAVGEIGLDYYWDEPDRETQKKWFIKQLQLAGEADLPIILHSREAAKDTLDLLREYKAHETGGVMHCYSYSRETAREVLEMGLYIGVGGVITFTNAKKLKEVVEYLPLDRILLETDCPYLAPVPYRGKRNSSLYLPYIAEEIARLKGITYEEVVAATRQNARDLFEL